MKKRALYQWFLFLKNDQNLQSKFKPTKALLFGLKLNQLQFKGKSETYTEDQKNLMEFCALMIELYGPEIGVQSNWFSNDFSFNKSIDNFITQQS